jgi:hypothetical protein
MEDRPFLSPWLQIHSIDQHCFSRPKEAWQSAVVPDPANVVDTPKKPIRYVLLIT